MANFNPEARLPFETQFIWNHARPSDARIDSIIVSDGAFFINHKAAVNPGEAEPDYLDPTIEVAMACGFAGMNRIETAEYQIYNAHTTTGHFKTLYDKLGLRQVGQRTTKPKMPAAIGRACALNVLQLGKPITLRERPPEDIITTVQGLFSGMTFAEVAQQEGYSYNIIKHDLSVYCRESNLNTTSCVLRFLGAGLLTPHILYNPALLRTLPRAVQESLDV